MGRRISQTLRLTANNTAIPRRQHQLTTDGRGGQTILIALWQGDRLLLGAKVLNKNKRAFPVGTRRCHNPRREILLNGTRQGQFINKAGKEIALERQVVA